MRVSDGRASMGGRTDFMNPPFTNYGSKSSSRGPPPKRNRQGKMKGGGQKARREDETAELYKKVRGVLNKLTPQKFDMLLSQIKALNIDTMERVQGVIDLVFEKAVDEPNFTVACALMCKELALMQVPTAQSTPEKPDFVNFRKLLITRCQVEFEKQSVDESVRNNKVKEIEECNDPEKRKDLQFELEEYDRRLRMKSVGNIRFIGELFKKGMLTVNIMMRVLGNLLDHKDEESLECLSVLLTTVGKELECKSGINLSQIFGAIKAIVEKRDGKVSNKVRFMLQDVIDLRNSKWVPRRQDLNPKTIEQIQKEADSEQLNIQLLNSVPMTPRKDQRMGLGPNLDRKGGRGGRNVSSDDGWIVNTNRNRTPFSGQSDKLKSKAEQKNVSKMAGSEQAQKRVCRYCSKNVTKKGVHCVKCGAYLHSSCADRVKQCCGTSLTIKQLTAMETNSSEMLNMASTEEIYLREENKRLRDIIEEKNTIIKEKEALITRLQEKVIYLQNDNNIKKCEQPNSNLSTFCIDDEKSGSEECNKKEKNKKIASEFETPKNANTQTKTLKEGSLNSTKKNNLVVEEKNEMGPTYIGDKEDFIYNKPEEDEMNNLKLNEANDGVEKVTHRRSKKNRALHIVGTAKTDSEKFKAVKRPKRIWLYVSNFNPNLDQEELEDYLNSKYKRNDFLCFKMKTKHLNPSFSSFKVGGDLSLETVLLDPNSWNEGISVSKFN